MHRLSILLLLTLLMGCETAWNDPYPAAERGRNVLYSAFTDRPKHLDPVQSYSSDEITFTAQIYEPPLQYHYLRRPYELIAATAAAVPQPRYLDAAGKRLPQSAEAARIAFTDYVIDIKPGIRFQPHPAFARTAEGVYVYHELTPAALAEKYVLSDFPLRDTRELTAADYVYGIKRLAHPRLHSPILGLMSEYIVGLGDLAKNLQKSALTSAANARRDRADGWLDLRAEELVGVAVLDRYSYRIRIRGKYPQFLYWLTMPFFAPMPWEADKFHSQPGMAEKNLTLDWYPIGTGPYMLTENNPNARMVLERNPHFRGESYPCDGEPEDRQSGLLDDCGKSLPFIDKVIFTREKEQIPYWNKFLQGYYDASGISSDSFDQAIQVGSGGEVSLTAEMRAQGIRLATSVATTSFYMGFNMLDPLVGGSSEQAQKLRQAIAIAIDQEEFISIFQNGRGIAAQGPIPPGIFGYRSGRDGVNPVMYDWTTDGPRRKSVAQARQLLAAAGWPAGRHAKTGEPLVIHLDTTATGVGAKTRIDWLNKQFQKIDVQLVVRSTDYNRFQEKVRKGAVQLFYLGWNADYPDPENFLFLLYGPQGKVKHNGENAANYANAEYDRLFEQMRALENSPRRQALINRMMVILQGDTPWVWGFHPLDYSLHHVWLLNRKPSKVGNNTMKYQRVDAKLRQTLRDRWNHPIVWPLGLMVALLVLLALPALLGHRRRESATAH
ncbi:MAG: ABC transporter substrate-binding protein [Gammaproteobacteria bacterium]|nr:peptide ABC transporter substrate-binding protein [Rhodocyclaceae bacterium]MBU3908507.1 ABC transporter substrate-binding protein [Gammaproteobacteria bacterium]MBU3990488.1 ABC transporter substrate-binding protein [Gammaproteobacteria bacterium]MBU4004535.1 ABC transporter substrate-binding protein [Gammaproteobacteria bacterium]MBU4021138.1 ABC transporter substrate-binding protein [Gammaproteobacteria bacterium]